MAALTKIAGGGTADSRSSADREPDPGDDASTADASRALYGIALDDMTIRQLHHLNHLHVPRAA